MLEELKKRCLTCRGCALAETRTNVVFGTGNEKAEIMFIGEAPGKNEDLSGTPFVGRAGQLLDKYLEAVGLERSDVYIANIIKCRPPQNRDPKPEEQAACIGYLKEQFRIIDPKIVVCLGRIAVMQMIDPDFKITKEHGRLYDRDGILFTATFHPAALLRNPNYKPETLEDFKMIAKTAEQLRNAETAT